MDLFVDEPVFSPLFRVTHLLFDRWRGSGRRAALHCRALSHQNSATPLGDEWSAAISSICYFSCVTKFCGWKENGKKKELGIQPRKELFCHLSLSAIILWADNVWVCFAHSVASRWLFYWIFIQMGAHQIHVRWDIVVAPLMSVLRPLESVPETQNG